MYLIMCVRLGFRVVYDRVSSVRATPVSLGRVDSSEHGGGFCQCGVELSHIKRMNLSPLRHISSTAVVCSDK